MGYPFELEWVEGAVLQQVIRLLSGQKLYVSPSLEYVPLVYNPLYFYISAIAARIIGTGFMPLRLVSFLASIGILSLIYLFIWRETGNRYVAVLASGLFAATFRLSGAWLDIARVDTLFVFFLLAALHALRFGNSVKTHVLAGALLVLAFQTKQTALAALLPMTLYALLRNWRRAMAFGVTALSGTVISMIILDFLHEGWYRFYAASLVSGHERLGSIGGFWNHDLIEPLPVACGLAVFYFAAQWPTRANRFIFYFFTGGGLLGMSWINSQYNGSYNNVLMPAYAAMAILFGLGIHQALDIINGMSHDGRHRLEILVSVLGIAQFAALIYNPAEQVPSQTDILAGQSLVGQLSAVAGPVYIPAHGYVAILAGKTPTAHSSALAELIGGYGGEAAPAGDQLLMEQMDAFRQHKFDLVIIDCTWSLRGLEGYYIPFGTAFGSPDAFWPVTGHQTRPDCIYVPRPSS